MNLQKVTARDTASNVVQDLSYRWTLDHRLEDREDRSTSKARSDHYEYDSVKRLTSWSGGFRGWGEITYEYDDLGNLKRRTTKGKTAKNEVFTSGGFLAPGTPGLSPSPYAITSGPDGTYAYDDVGDQVTAPGRNVEWTTFHLPRVVKTDSATASYLYDATRQRARKTEERTTGAGGTTMTYYASDGLYELRRTGELDDEVFTVTAGGRTLAQVIRSRKGGVLVDNRKLFIRPDHLGSPHVINDGFGKQVEVRLHEPFGRRVDRDDPTLPLAPSVSASPVTQGLTGHEQEDGLDLINIRGRIYDPKVGRFLSQDPVIGMWGQRINRYSYVGNDPINRTDPSGFCYDTIFGCLPNAPISSTGLNGSIQFGFGGPAPEAEPIGNESKKPPTFTPAAQPPKPTTYTPASPLNAGVGPISPVAPTTLGGGGSTTPGAIAGEDEEYATSWQRWLIVNGEDLAKSVGETSLAIGGLATGLVEVGVIAGEAAAAAEAALAFGARALPSLGRFGASAGRLAGSVGATARALWNDRRGAFRWGGLVGLSEQFDGSAAA